jgi:hypothetical protein
MAHPDTSAILATTPAQDVPLAVILPAVRPVRVALLQKGPQLLFLVALAAQVMQMREFRSASLAIPL